MTIQETKLRGNNFKIAGYQVYQMNRIGLGGGILTAVDENIGSVLVTSTDSANQSWRFRFESDKCLWTTRT